MQKEYQKLNNLLGWLIFILASVVYIITSEPTASFWDCGEYIATAYKLQVGHPPGAPFFQLLGRFFSLFAFGDVTQVARMVNTMSALMSGATILFLFWTITALGRKIAFKNGEITRGAIYAVLGSGLVGSLAYTFSDSFWFSAVEGEVYATSAFFSAIVFWAILKWESVADQPRSDRWIILIFYLIGLSVGVHLLNLLAIPAMTFVYYFKRYKATFKGFIITAIVSLLILGGVQSVIIPQIVNLFAQTELLFVNSFGLPFESGTIFFVIVLLGLIGLGLWYTTKKQKAMLNTIILSFVVLLIGYSSFFLLVIRSQANPPIDENNPENAISMLAYLNREQYGDWPILYGQYFNAPLDRQKPYKNGTPVYERDYKTGKYVISDDRKSSIPNYDPEFCTIFPRMWSTQANHAAAYRSWSNMEGTPISTVGYDGKKKVINKPTFGENLRFFFNYQVGWMYMRYFLWNFAGRQNDVQGHSDNLHGNWISGIKAIDSARLGTQDNLPEFITKSKGNNKFYMLPLLLGLIGFVYHYARSQKNWFVVLLLFFLTGLAIVVYLNQYPYQPRERDYAYAGSFYAFAIWIGLGVMAIWEFLSKKVPAVPGAIATTVACGLLVPFIMAKEGWDDHDRSNRFTALHFASNYLNSCAPNAILFTNGDNDTFPLWYAQEVEGVRTDVRVCNLSLLNTDWYIDQMKRKAYDSEPVPFSMTRDQYKQGTRDYVIVYENKNLQDYVDLKEIMDFVKSDNPATKLPLQGGPREYFPTRKFRIPVDTAKVIANGTVSADQVDNVVKNVDWEITDNALMKNHLMVLDLLAHFKWDRPVYFAITTGNDAYIGLENYFQLEGLAYRLIPVKDTINDGQIGIINTSIMYDNLMNKFKWGNMNNPSVYLDETNMRMTMNFRNNFSRLADALTREGKKDSALSVLNKCMEVMPDEAVPYNFFMLPITEQYYRLEKPEVANQIATRLVEIYDIELNYYFSLDRKYFAEVDIEAQRALSVLQRLALITRTYKQDDLNKVVEDVFGRHYESYKRMKPSTP
ncbi:MAG: DUF2723 domain-containing protein [Bacteroidetes bacterium]|nr:DUF2723 domain-containing protein [Bacteroidota bacterium]